MIGRHKRDRYPVSNQVLVLVAEANVAAGGHILAQMRLQTTETGQQTGIQRLLVGDQLPVVKGERVAGTAEITIGQVEGKNVPTAKPGGHTETNSAPQR